MAKKEKWLVVLIVVGVFVGIFLIGLYELGLFKFFAPRRENIRREVFEQTQSYVHGKIQDLAKYYDEYEEAAEDEREALRQVIIMRFAEFDETQIRSAKLRNFLITMRRY